MLDIRMLVGDFNAKVGRKGSFGPTVGKHSLHEKTGDNGFRLISFAAAQNMVISSNRLISTRRLGVPLISMLKTRLIML